MATIRKRGEIYYLFYSVGKKKRKKSLKTTKRAEAQIKLGKWEDTEKRRGAAITHTPTADVIEEYLKHVTQTLSGRTYEDSVNCFRLFFGPASPSLKFDPRNVHQQGAAKRWARRDGGNYQEFVSRPYFEDITTRDISDWLRNMTQHRNWSAVTQVKKREQLSALWKWALKTYGLRRTGAEVEINPVRAVPARKIPLPVIVWLNRGQIDEQLEALASEPQVQAMVATYVYAGLRCDELLHLQHRDVCLDESLIYIRRKEWPGGKWQPKNERSTREVNISSDLRPYLQDQLKRSRIVTNQWFFPSPEGCLWPPRNFTRKLGILHSNMDPKLEWTPMIYRHTFASILMGNSVSSDIIAKCMGNTAAVVERHYGSLRPKDLAKYMEFGPGHAAAG